MVQASRRTIVRGPTFVRLLARLAGGATASSAPPLSERLSQWLDWNQAIALSTALDGKPADAGFDGSPADDDAEEEECGRVRMSLAQAIASAPELTPPHAVQSDQAPAGASAAGTEADYGAFRQRYLTLQRSMQAATGRLRGRLRDRLAQRSADLARLADLDAVMELTLSPREQALLATVPGLLGAHFERLRQTGAMPPDEVPPGAAGPWLDIFRKDMQSVLLAELDVRFQPVEGLLAALRAR